MQKMFDMLKVLFYVIVVFGSYNYFTVAFPRRCYDCVSLASCESGMKFAAKVKAKTDRLGFVPRENVQVQLIDNAICGTNPILKVCCSDFPQPIDIGDRLQTATVATTIPNKDEIEMHPNLRLLPNDMCGGINGLRIFDGRVPRLNELPWMTLISFIKTNLDFGCGGSIINSRYILTAAHCVIKNGELKNNIAGVRVGEFDLSDSNYCQGDFDNRICESDVQDIGIEKIIYHENFTGIVPQKDDIALIRLKEAITFRNNTAPICLPVYSALRRDRLSGKRATMAGWGATENDNRSNQLLKVTIQILTDDVCGSYYRRLNQNPIEKTFCAGELNKDSCAGDSGGPLIIESDFDGQIRMVQFGIISLGSKDCGTEFPGIFTDVTKYMDWILDNIRE